MQQLQKKLEHFQLGLEKLNGVMHVVTAKSLREGDVVGFLSLSLIHI